MYPIKLNGSTLQPEEPIQGYSNLIWNERFSMADEFSLVTPDIERTLEQLPHDSLISLQDSERFMIVENHEISKNSEGGYELTVTGYGFEGFYKHRVVTVKNFSSKEWTINATPEVIVQILLSENVGFDAREGFQRVDQYRPGFVQTGLAEIKRVIQDGELESVINDLLTSYNIGLHSARPTGNRNYTDISTVVVHQGIDHSLGVSDNPIVFDSSAGDISDESYIDSSADYKNLVYQVQYDNTEGTSSSNLYPGYWFPGISTKVAFDSTDWDEWADEKLSQRRELYNRKRRQKLFQGTVKLPPGVIYGTNLNIGDLVTVKGSFGFEDKMRLTEFTRIEDAEGERSYPTLAKDKDLPDE